MKTHLVCAQAKAEYVCIEGRGLMNVTLFMEFKGMDKTSKKKLCGITVIRK